MVMVLLITIPLKIFLTLNVLLGLLLKMGKSLFKTVIQPTKALPMNFEQEVFPLKMSLIAISMTFKKRASHESTPKSILTISTKQPWNA